MVPARLIGADVGTPLYAQVVPGLHSKACADTAYGAASMPDTRLWRTISRRLRAREIKLGTIRRGYVRTTRRIRPVTEEPCATALHDRPARALVDGRHPDGVGRRVWTRLGGDPQGGR